MKDLSQRSEAACAQSVSEVMQHWSASDQRLQCGLCESCRVAVRRADIDPTVLRTLAVLRLDSMYASQTTKRQSADSVCPGATCVVCQIETTEPAPCCTRTPTEQTQRRERS